MMGCVAYRTPFVQYTGQNDRWESEVHLIPVLDWLTSVVTTNFQGFAIEHFLLGNTATPVGINGYPIRRIIAQHPFRHYLQHANISYIDNSCSTSFNAIKLLSYSSKLKCVNIYMGHENFTILDKEYIISLAKESPEQWEPKDFALHAAHTYGISKENIETYLSASQARWHAFQGIAEYIGFLISTPIGCYDTLVEKPVQICNTTDPIYLARLASGSTVIVLTENIEIIKELGGVRTRGMGVATQLGSLPSIDPIIVSIQNALRNSNSTLDEIDVFEILDTYPTVMLAIAHRLGINLDRVNIAGGAIVRGDGVAAAGGMLLANVQALFKLNPEYQLGLIVSYTPHTALSMVVERL